MEDLLGIECTTNLDGSITLHQSKYINSMINRFFTTEERDGLKKVSTPYTSNLAQLVIEALDGSTASQPAYPELVKEYQRMVGSLMYCCTATRPDLAYAVHQHCRALSRPTPELLAELRVTFNKLCCVLTCLLGFSCSYAERHVAHVCWFVVFVPGSVHLPDSSS